MPGTAGPNLGLIYGYSAGETGWGTGGFNPNMEALDALVQLSVLSQQDSPPGSPSAGDRYIVGAGSGAWAGHDDEVARWTGSAWEFFAPKVGWLAWNEAAAALWRFTTAWAAVPAALADGSVTTTKMGGDVTTAGKALLTATDAAAQRTALGLGSAAEAASSVFAAEAHSHAPGDVTGLGDYIRDEVGALLVAGDGISIAQDSVTGAVTIESTVTGGGGGVEVRDEGASISGAATMLDFVGAGVTATTVAGGVQVSIPGGGGSSLEVRDEGTSITGAAAMLDFRGAGVTATTVAGGVQVSIPGAGGGGGNTWSIIMKPSAESRSNTTTLADDSVLKNTFVLGSNKFVVVRAKIYYQGNATADFKWGWDFTNAPAVQAFHIRQQAPSTPGGTDNETTETRDFNFSGAIDGGSDLGMLEMELVLFALTGSTKVAFQWAQNVSSANQISVLHGSYLEYFVVP